MSKSRAVAWAKVVDALNEQRAAIEYRIHRADSDDIYLEYDAYGWVVLVDAITDFLKGEGVGCLTSPSGRRSGGSVSETCGPSSAIVAATNCQKTMPVRSICESC
jgi:hypothetical protein